MVNDEAPAELPSDRRRRRKISDAQIMTAAIAEFAEHGFATASMDAIAKRAATSKPTLYANFGSKDELYTAALQAEANALRHTLLNTYARTTSQPVSSQMHAGNQAMFDYAAEHPHGLKLLFGTNPGVSPQHTIAHQALEDILAAVTGLVDGTIQRTGVATTESSRLFAEMIIALVIAAVRHSAESQTIDPSTAAALAESLLLDGLRNLDTTSLKPMHRNTGRPRTAHAIPALD